MELRKQEGRPWHSPPHYESDETTCYLLTAACFEHKHHIGSSVERMVAFEDALVAVLEAGTTTVFAWNVLPNHYHALVDTPSMKNLIRELGQLHGRTSFHWNGEEERRGRQVWCNMAETAMKSDGHFYASLNYVLHNAVHHGYVERWTDWPFCNATQYLAQIGRDQAQRLWRQYPLFDYGKNWDPPEL